MEALSKMEGLGLKFRCSAGQNKHFGKAKTMKVEMM